MLSCLGFLTPRAKPWVWAVPFGGTQEVGGSQLHLEEACGRMSRERETSESLVVEGENGKSSLGCASLPTPEELAADLCA